MRDRRVRIVFLGLILALPVLLAAASTRQGRAGSSARETSQTLLGVEAVVVGGLFFASRQRRRLLAGHPAAPAWPNPALARVQENRIAAPHANPNRSGRPVPTGA